jgi:hypothetical protein
MQVRVGKEVIGETYVNWLEAINFTKEYCQNKAFMLYKDKKPTNNKIYASYRFLTKADFEALNLSRKT